MYNDVRRMNASLKTVTSRFEIIQRNADYVLYDTDFGEDYHVIGDRKTAFAYVEGFVMGRDTSN